MMSDLMPSQLDDSASMTLSSSQMCNNDMFSDVHGSDQGDWSLSRMGGVLRRPLSAYNIFFQLERRRLIRGEPERSFGDVEVRELLAEQRVLRNQPKAKRLHRKTHGKVSFKELATGIANKWKSLDEEKKDFFESYASQEKKAYEKAKIARKVQASSVNQSHVPCEEISLIETSCDSPETPRIRASNPVEANVLEDLCDDLRSQEYIMKQMMMIQRRVQWREAMFRRAVVQQQQQQQQQAMSRRASMDVLQQQQQAMSRRASLETVVPQHAMSRRGSMDVSRRSSLCHPAIVPSHPDCFMPVTNYPMSNMVSNDSLCVIEDDSQDELEVDDDNDECYFDHRHDMELANHVAMDTFRDVENLLFMNPTPFPCRINPSMSARIYNNNNHSLPQRHSPLSGFTPNGMSLLNNSFDHSANVLSASSPTSYLDDDDNDDDDDDDSSDVWG